jgi:hypothetical protein
MLWTYDSSHLARNWHVPLHRGAIEFFARTTRVFLNGDGSIESQENTTVTFSQASANRMRVALAGKTVIEGEGYCLGDQCHYETTIAPGHRLEFTFDITRTGLIGWVRR